MAHNYTLPSLRYVKAETFGSEGSRRSFIHSNRHYIERTYVYIHKYVYYIQKYLPLYYRCTYTYVYMCACVEWKACMQLTPGPRVPKLAVLSCTCVFVCLCVCFCFWFCCAVSCFVKAGAQFDAALILTVFELKFVNKFIYICDQMSLWLHAYWKLQIVRDQKKLNNTIVIENAFCCTIVQKLFRFLNFFWQLTVGDGRSGCQGCVNTL